MSLEVDYATIQKNVQDAHARWTTGVTPLTNLSTSQKKIRCGASPPNGVKSLSDRVTSSAKNATATATASTSNPTTSDWRNHNGNNYITPIRDQSSCGSCVAFGCCAATEGTYEVVTNSPGYSIDLSEAQLFYCDASTQSCNCETGWWPDNALAFLKNPGICDEAAFPYTPGDQPCKLPADWETRLTVITGYHSITDTTQMKQWLSTQGPLVTCFSVYQDFYNYSSGVYHYVSGSLAGGHCVCIIGYDDNQQCWFAKNSWGTGWGEKGFFQIAYGSCGIDAEMWAIEGAYSDKVILPEEAIGAPALANISDSKLVVAWTGTDSSHHLNVECSRDAGKTFTGKVILGETSIDGPSLTVANGKLFLAWTGTDSSGHLNVNQSTDCATFTNKVTLSESSHYGPALAYGNGKLYMAWVGTDSNHSLNINSSADGITWGNKVTLGEASDSAVNLFFANNILYLMWQGTDSKSSLNIIQSTNGTTWTNKITSTETSDFKPAMTNINTELFLAWTGRDSNHSLNTETTTAGTNSFANKLTYGNTAAGGVGLTTYAGKVYITWTGTDSSHHVNVMCIT
jgi:C1A family cysteine protease